MTARFTFADPMATMTVTMTIQEWEDLRDQLDHLWPSSQLATCITNLLSAARLPKPPRQRPPNPTTPPARM